jgi:hypothetical protein
VAAASSPELQVLVALRLCSLAEPDTLARRTGLGEGEVRALLAAAEGPGCADSYHTVWFELHEHLLATLDLERADGGAAV